MMLKEIKKDTEAKMMRAIVSVEREFSEVRTGRAHPGLIEGMHVDYYGTPTLLKQLASITIPDPKTVLIQPWDPAAIADIEKTIMNSKLGVTPNSDGKIIRLNIPPLSTERREELKKVVKDMAEHGRISLRSIRRESNDKIKKAQHDHSISDDDSFKGQEDIQKLTDQYIKQVDVILTAKNKELEEFN
ncbi:MAG: ribosome recycling factor [Candidatus Omnitrophica bacterium]|nr:ribosome recycling factor [Candidatus Omnitrophota bacterium]